MIAMEVVINGWNGMEIQLDYCWNVVLIQK
jgi:hypothetical protein